MTHKAESVLSAVTTALTGLATTGANVQRARAWPVSSLPALTISKGADRVIDEMNIGVIRRELLVDIAAQVSGITNLETALHVIAAEVYAALTADITLGGAASDVRLVEDFAPEVEAEQDVPTARMVMQYLVNYRHSATTAES